MRYDANPTHQRHGGTGRARLLTGEVAMALMHEAPARRGRATTRRSFRMSMALLVCWMGVLSTSLLGYAVFGKGWAYVGVPPLFIGELVLLSGVVVLLACTPWWTMLEALSAWPLFALMIWGTVRTLPYLSVHGIDAMRDAVIWGYGTFAFIVFGCLVAAPSMLPRLLSQYCRFTRIFLVCVPVVAILTMFMGDIVPRWPSTNIPIVYAKAGDVLVHLGAILAFWSTGLGRPVALPLVILFTANVAMMGAQSRGGLLAFLAGFLVCVLTRPHARALRLVLAAAVCGFVVLAVTNVRFQVAKAWPTERRPGAGPLLRAVHRERCEHLLRVDGRTTSTAPSSGVWIGGRRSSITRSTATTSGRAKGSGSTWRTTTGSRWEETTS